MLATASETVLGKIVIQQVIFGKVGVKKHGRGLLVGEVVAFMGRGGVQVEMNTMIHD